MIDLPITFQEVTQAVKGLSSEKAPGLDRFPFYKVFIKFYKFFIKFYKHFINIFEM